MKDQSESNQANSEASAGEQEAANLTPAKKAYEAPVLMIYGDVRDLTLGGSLGIGESGAETFLRND